MTSTEPEIRPDVWCEPWGLPEKFLLLCLALCGLVGAVVFFLPYDFIADEGEYLGEIISLANGTPEGWIIRSFVYPALLAPGVVISDALGFSDPESLTLAARLMNWPPAWLSALLAYAIGARIHSRCTGLLAAIFLLGSWAWMLNAKRVMMDVPSAFWLLLALYALLLGADKTRNVLLAVVAGSLAVFTKFQSGPATAMIGLLLVMAPSARGRRLWNFIVAALASVGMIAIYSAVDMATYGAPFVSFIEFVKYNFSGAEFIARYGPCESPFYYAVKGPANVYSYLFPIFLAVGVGVCLRLNTSSRLVLIVCAAQLTALHLVCHKETRYLLQIAPMLAIIASVGLTWLMDRLYRAAHVASARELLAKRLTLLVLIGSILATLASFVPRNEVRKIIASAETCRAFVQSLMTDVGAELRAERIALVAPCDVPRYYIEGLSVETLSQGHNEHTRALRFAQFRASAPSYALIVLESGSPPEGILKDSWPSLFRVLARSPEGTYTAYIRDPIAR